jgi:hypothetical protein
MSEALEWWIVFLLLILGCLGVGAILGAVQSRAAAADDASRAERPWPMWPH